MNTTVKIEKFLAKDLAVIPDLQPDGWPDIFPSIQYYCSSNFCFPLKATLDGKVVGIGTAIIYGSTAWLAHIVVHKDYRNAGIGTAVTQSLVELIQHTPCETILLIATNLGEPVYKKLGFEVQTQYIFFDEGTLPPPATTSNQISVLQNQHQDALMHLDRTVSGEQRIKLFEGHFTTAQAFVHKNTLKGFYMPTVGEGLIIADTPEAGFELMKVRATSTNKFCIPVDNTNGVNFLTEHGFKENRRASRMALGKKLVWDGSKLFSRIGGNLG